MRDDWHCDEIAPRPAACPAGLTNDDAGDTSGATRPPPPPGTRPRKHTSTPTAIRPPRASSQIVRVLTAPPPSPPRLDLRWFCKESSSTSSFYDRCDGHGCTEAPQCCDYLSARVSTHYQGAKRCTSSDDSALAAAAGGDCAGLPLPAGCQAAAPPPPPVAVDARWFCQERATQSSYYDKCEACVSTPLCCDFALGRTSSSASHRLADGTDGRRCTARDASGTAGVGLCTGLALPRACPGGIGGGH